MSDFLQGLFGTQNASQSILRAAQAQTDKASVTSVAGGKQGDAYCMHSITAASKQAGYNELHRELRSTLGNVNSFVALAKKHGAYHASNGNIPPAETAAIMDLFPHRPDADHVGISYGDGRYREANPGFRDVERGSTGITGYVDLDVLNRSISRKRTSSLENIPGVSDVPNPQLAHSEVADPASQHIADKRAGHSSEPARGA